MVSEMTPETQVMMIVLITLGFLLSLNILMVINALSIISFHNATQEGEILNFIDRWFKNMPDWFKKPVYDCPTCMASLHSTYVYWGGFALLHFIASPPLLLFALIYPVYILALSATATWVYKMMEDE